MVFPNCFQTANSIVMDSSNTGMKIPKIVHQSGQNDKIL